MHKLRSKYFFVVDWPTKFCFVEKETGNVFKPAGWRAPYLKGKNAVRGNIYDLSCIPDNANMCGGWLYII